MQSFIRRKQGKENLDRLIKGLENRQYAIAEHAESFFRIQGILREVDAIKNEITKLDARISFLFPDNELIRVRDALRERLNNLLKELEQRAKSK